MKDKNLNRTERLLVAILLLLCKHCNISEEWKNAILEEALGDKPDL